MDVMELGAIGELVGGFAVLVTLIYLAIQVRQGTAALGSNWHHDMLDSALRHSLVPISESRELAEFIRRGKYSPEELDDVDWDRFVRHAYGMFGMWEDALVSHRKKLIDAEYWKSWDGACRSLYMAPGYRKFWEQERDGHSAAFQDYIDSAIFPKDPGS